MEHKCKAPVTQSRVSTALAQSCLIFHSPVRSQENRDIIVERAYQEVFTAIMALLRSSHGILYRVPTEFLLGFLCGPLTLSGRSLRQGSARRIEDAVIYQRTHYNLLANAMDNHRVCTMTLVHFRGAPIAL